MVPGELDPHLLVHRDEVNGKAKFTYVTIESTDRTALAMLVLVDPRDGAPCFQIGYAAPQACRRPKMRQRDIAELWPGLAHNGVIRLSVEAVSALTTPPHSASPSQRQTLLITDHVRCYCEQVIPNTYYLPLPISRWP